MTLGPVSYTVVAFPGNHFNGSVAPEVEKLISNGTVRILDLVFVGKDEEGDTSASSSTSSTSWRPSGTSTAKWAASSTRRTWPTWPTTSPRATRRSSSSGRTCGRSLWSTPYARREEWWSTRRASRPPSSRRHWPRWPRRSRPSLNTNERRQDGRERNETDAFETTSGDADGGTDRGHRGDGHRRRRRGEPAPATSTRNRTRRPSSAPAPAAARRTAAAAAAGRPRTT